VTRLYVATFDRAPDSAGLNYWVNSGTELENIASSFFDQEETNDLYGEVSDLDNFIVAIYSNLFKREPKADGQAYWKDQLENGIFNSSQFILAVTNGAKDNDKTILDNKTEVGLAFANKGLSNINDARIIMSEVDGTEESKLVALNEFGLGDGDKDLIPDEKIVPKEISTTEEILSSNITDGLDMHNQIRGEVFLNAPMSWSDEITTSAQAYADILGANGEMKHDKNNNKYGENLAISSGSMSYKGATSMWYEEKQYYTYGDGFKSETGHYTQIIWKNSIELGCGSSILQSGDFKGGTIVVCRYSPAGNYNGQDPY
nr:DUF4214 domain-containing protein [Sulfurovaceae bacterium]